MPKNKRIKNGKTQYKTQFRWTDENGNVHKSNTSWCNSKLEADNEAEKLRAAKSALKTPRNKKAIDVYNEFMDYVEKQAFDDSLITIISDSIVIQDIFIKI